MKPNLETLKNEIRAHLESNGLAVFAGHVSELHEQRLVIWDVEHESDFRKFVDCAIQAQVKLMVFNYSDLDRSMIDEAIERLEDTDLTREEQRAIERRLKELRAFDGFTCAVEMSFEYGGRVYLYNLRTDWYEELLDLMEQIEIAVSDGDKADGDEDEPMGGYFSRN